jgi:hypothetical protein
MRKLYSLPEVLALLPLSRTQLYREMDAGRLEFIQAGKRRLFEPEAIDRFVASLKDTSGVGRLLELVDDDGRIDVGQIPADVSIADLAEVRRLVNERAVAV